MSGAAQSVNQQLAFSNPSLGKIDQQRKILEELERQKKQLTGGSGSGNELTLDPSSMSGLTSSQRSALENAAKTSFGYFIAQDSSFGNTILPVIPRPK